MGHRSCLILAAVVGWQSSASGALTSPILEYRINSAVSGDSAPAATKIVNSGSIGANGDLTMFGTGDPSIGVSDSGQATNFYTADGLGVSGLPGDRAFDNGLSAGMGNAAGYSATTNRGPGATNNAVHGILAGKTQLTITGWLRTAPGSTWTGLSQVWAGDAGNYMHIRGSSGRMQFELRTGENTASTLFTAADAHWNAQDQWMFVGLTWNSDLEGRCEFFYVDEASQVQSGALFELTTANAAIQQTTNIPESNLLPYGLTLGNQSGWRLRPFDGLLDNFRVFDTALELADLQTIVNKDRLNLDIFSPSPTADFDASGIVDAADLTAWSNNFGLASGASASQGDADLDGDVDGADFLQWQRQFGPAASQPAGWGVPESDTAVLLSVALVAMSSFRRNAPLS